MLQEERPEAYEVLRHTPLTEFIEPVPQPLLKPTDTLKEALTLFSGYSNEFFYVSSDGLQLNGLLTMTDLFRTLESGAEMDMPVTEFMIKDPVTVSVNDTGLVAALTLRDYRLKWVPVVDPEQGRRIAGYISARKIMAYVLKETRIFS